MSSFGVRADADQQSGVIDHIDVLLDEALRETFPASDPIAISIDAGKAANVSGTSRSVQSIAAGNAMDAAAAAITPAIQTTIYDNGVILVERLLPAARKRLVSVAEDAPLLAAARLLRTGIDLVVACSSGGILTGVVTKTDVVRQVSDSEGGSCVIAASFVMTRNVVSCRLAERVQDVWARMKERGLKNVPITDDEGRPIGVLNARDMLQVLLQDVQQEEKLLRDYVMGVGYR